MWSWLLCQQGWGLLFKWGIVVVFKWGILAPSGRH